MHYIVNMLSHVIHHQHTRPHPLVSLFGAFLLAEISWLNIEIMLSINNRIQTKLVGLITIPCRLVLSILHVVYGDWMWNYVSCKPISVITYPCRDLTLLVKAATSQFNLSQHSCVNETFYMHYNQFSSHDENIVIDYKACVLFSIGNIVYSHNALNTTMSLYFNHNVSIQYASARLLKLALT